jgi:ATP synthase protein I
VVAVAFDDEVDDRPAVQLTPEQARALRDRIPLVSPWRVVATQAAVGVVVGALAWWISGRFGAAVSAWYGAAVVVVPGVLMARGVTRRSLVKSSGARAIGVLAWVPVKMGVAVLMLMLAPRIVQPLNWPALLVALVVCMKVYWVALLWRGRKREREMGQGRHGS